MNKKWIVLNGRLTKYGKMILRDSTGEITMVKLDGFVLFMKNVNKRDGNSIISYYSGWYNGAKVEFKLVQDGMRTLRGQLYNIYIRKNPENIINKILE